MEGKNSSNHHHQKPKPKWKETRQGPKKFRDMKGEFGPKIVPTLNLNLTHEGQKIM